MQVVGGSSTRNMSPLDVVVSIHDETRIRPPIAAKLTEPTLC